MGNELGERGGGKRATAADDKTAPIPGKQLLTQQLEPGPRRVASGRLDIQQPTIPREPGHADTSPRRTLADILDRRLQKRLQEGSRLQIRRIPPGASLRVQTLTAAWKQVDQVQLASDHVPPGTQHDANAAVHAAAAEGISGPAGKLPHLEPIQRSFGGHDVSHIEAHVGGPAAAGAKAMGAEAYATGRHVAFAEAPSLHTAAHEAAHVIQQQGGVQLKGGVGEAGDAYERHADAVADKVVCGESAEALLDQHASPGSGKRAVQRKEHKEDAQILEHQASLKNTDVEIPALEGALVSTRNEAVKKGLLSKPAFDASLDLSQAMTQLQPAVAAKGGGYVDVAVAVDVGVQERAALAAQLLFSALRRETADDKNLRVVQTIGAGAEGGITEQNPYTEQERVTTPSLLGSSAHEFAGPLAKLPALIRQRQWQPAFELYRRQMTGLDLWVADQLRRAGKGTPDEARGNAHVHHSQLRTGLDEIAGKHATRLPALFHPDPKLVEKEKAAGHPTAETVPMNVYVWKDEQDGKFHLYDLTAPSQPHEQAVDGPPTAAAMNTFFEEVARYPEGEVRYTLPDGIAGVAPTTGKTKWYEWLGYAGLAVAAVGLGFLTAGASVAATVCFAGGALASGVSAGGHLVDTAHLGTATTVTVVLDVAQIAASFASFGALGITVKAGSAMAALEGSRWLVPLAGTAAAADVVQMVALTDITVGELDRVQKGPGTPEDKQRAMAVLLTQLIVTGGLTALSVQGARNARLLSNRQLELIDQNGGKMLRVVGESTSEPVVSKPAAEDAHSLSSDASAKTADHSGLGPGSTSGRGPMSGAQVGGRSLLDSLGASAIEKLSKQLKPYEIEDLVRRLGIEKAKQIANTVEGSALRDLYSDVAFGRLREEAVEIRKAIFPGKEVGKKNIAVTEAHLDDGTRMSTSSTSGPQGQAPQPKPASQGGYFEPTKDSISGRVMDTDPEYKTLSQLAEWIEKKYPKGTHPTGTVYLYTEMEMCDSCAGIKVQFEAKFPGVNVIVVADHPYPFPK